jgi:hypothetical protein
VLEVLALVAITHRARNDLPANLAVLVKLTMVSMNPPLLPVHANLPPSSLGVFGPPPLSPSVVIYPLLAKAVPELVETTSNHVPPSTENSSAPPSLVFSKE